MSDKRTNIKLPDLYLKYIASQPIRKMSEYIISYLWQVLGRNVRDFINELDNLHEYFRFSFPKVQPPSFCVEEECETSLTLHYRSTRKGFTQFVKGMWQWKPWVYSWDFDRSRQVPHDDCSSSTDTGQLSQVGRQFYNTDIEVEILSKEETEKMTYVVRIRKGVFFPGQWCVVIVTGQDLSRF